MGYSITTKPVPNLDEGETALILDSGELVAVSIERRWIGNNSGILFVVRARHVDTDGSTHFCPRGQEVRAEASHSADAASINTFGADAIAREMLLAVAGEEPTQVERQGENGPFTAPMLMHSPEWRLNASIRHAIETVSATAPVHPAQLLQS